MAKFLRTAGASDQLEDLIMKAKERIILISPYLQISKTLQQRLSEASEKSISIKLVFRTDKLTHDQKKILISLPNVELHSLDSLHAKCYMNEDKMVITSMNMYEHSENKNREMGVLIDRKKDPELFKDAEIEALSILKAARKEEIRNKSKSITELFRKEKAVSTSFKPTVGYCIRCKDSIRYSIYSPLCDSCYTVWSNWGDSDYQENFCHRCGKDDSTSKSQPLCNYCFNQ